MTTVEYRKNAIRRLYKALEAGDVDIADELFTDDFVTSEGRHQNVRGPQGFKDAIRAVHETHADPSFEILDLIGEGQDVMVRWRMTATHSGPLMGVPATGERVSMEAFALFRFAGDRISERHAVIDRLGLLQQLKGE
ncbi:ester cyclase [Kitasatospora sp. CM 4170]|uniref:Ester cyclase n=1 Tax=Kitasatospora aburaviensis TaxID=67265 RepID=A0ABW1ES31_9ACTN|nr:ester cyclase [Kitasatospora sp. CM 4170]WNM45183.1 ester cyclase [Kitasatospora sp. CM 4170]